ncbi:hypothetical protein C8J56DRAFT_1166201 [Mycena floridula]|nr:hypothetical protein C8J56DRAFT_1166201 [Mycena floridula]
MSSNSNPSNSNETTSNENIIQPSSASSVDIDSGAAASTELAPNTDDSAISITDLLRSGEASRLRRRGARREPPSDTVVQLVELALMAHSGQRPAPGTADPRAPAAARQPGSWTDSTSPAFGSLPDSTFIWDTLRDLRREREDAQTVSYTLYCGSEPVLSTQPGLGSFRPNPLPWASDFTDDSRSQPKTTSITRSSGCGALIHTQAFTHSQGWTARTTAPEAVVPLDEHYFSEIEFHGIGKARCNCHTEGIGCANCGNPLGTRFKSCGRPSHSRAYRYYSMSNAARTRAPEDPRTSHIPTRPVSSHSARLRGPEGPRYWGHSVRPTSSPSEWLYTFYVTAAHAQLNPQDTVDADETPVPSSSRVLSDGLPPVFISSTRSTGPMAVDAPDIPISGIPAAIIHTSPEPTPRRRLQMASTWSSWDNDETETGARRLYEYNYLDDDSTTTPRRPFVPPMIPDAPVIPNAPASNWLRSAAGFPEEAGALRRLRQSRLIDPERNVDGASRETRATREQASVQQIREREREVEEDIARLRQRTGDQSVRVMQLAEDVREQVRAAAERQRRTDQRLHLTALAQESQRNANRDIQREVQRMRRLSEREEILAEAAGYRERRDRERRTVGNSETASIRPWTMWGEGWYDNNPWDSEGTQNWSVQWPEMSDESALWTSTMDAPSQTEGDLTEGNAAGDSAQPRTQRRPQRALRPTRRVSLRPASAIPGGTPAPSTTASTSNSTTQLLDPDGNPVDADGNLLADDVEKREEGGPDATIAMGFGR